MPALTRSQAKSSLARLQRHLAPILLQRLQRVVELLSETGETMAAEVQAALFPEAAAGAANKAFQRMRTDLASAAEEAGISLELRVLDTKSVGAALRKVWFEGELPSLDGLHRTEELDEVGDRLIEDVQGMPLDGEPRVRLTERSDGKPLVRIFVSYAHADAKLAHKLIEQLAARLASSKRFVFETWQDVELRAGEAWEQSIRGGLERAHLGLLLLSPHFFASKFIGEVELPVFVCGQGEGVEGKRVIPVELVELDFVHTNMRGLAARQIYRGPHQNFGPFPRRQSENLTKWMNGLVQSIHDILTRYADIEPEPPTGNDPPRNRRAMAQAVLNAGATITTQINVHGTAVFGGQDESGQSSSRPLPRASDMMKPDADLAAIQQQGCLVEDAQARVTHLDATLLDSGREATGSVNALEHVMAWLRDAAGPALFALLGEYGMGKTITCQRVVQAVERTNEANPDSLPKPLYFDLRRLTSLRTRGGVPKLGEVLDECIERGWTLTDDKPSAKELLGRATLKPMLFVFDGLDEALVHLSEADGREFTRELLRVRELSERSGFTTRVLLSCRTHYFRSLQEQDAHLTGHDRGRTKAKDYAALVLLPLGPEQVRRYLEQAVPELDIEGVITLVRSVHNLEELAARPYTLQLIADQIPRIEALRAKGETVRGVTLYRLMVDKWLNRDGTKHHIKPDHKCRLMRHLAAWTWGRGTRFVAASELEDWFGRWLGSDPGLHLRYASIGFDKLEEDLRTATFLVREDDASGQTIGFRFAHTSMQEFFLAGYLFEALEQNAPERWSLASASPETWDFFVQLLAERGGRELVGRMSQWCTGPVREARWLVFGYVLEGHRRGWPLPDLRGIDLSDISIQGCRIDGPLDLSGSRWDGAILRQMDWRNVIVDDASFEGADLRFSTWDHVQAKRASFARSRADGVVFRWVDLQGATSAGSEAAGCDFIRSSVPQAWPSHGRRVGHDLPFVLSKEVDIEDCAIAAVAWLPNGKAVVCGDGAVRVWDPRLGTSERMWRNPQEVQMCALSPSGRRVLTAGEDGTVRVWDVDSGQEVSLWHHGDVSMCAWSSDGDRVVTVGEDGTVRVWNANSGVREGGWDTLHGSLYSCTWSPNGKQVLTVGEEGTVRVWNAASGASECVWEGHQGAISSCSWSPDGKQVLTAGADGTVRVWDANSGASECVWEGHPGPIWCSWASDGKRAFVTGRDETVEWDVRLGTCVIYWEHDPVRNCVLSPDEENALAIDFGGALQLWSARTRALEGIWLHSEEEWYSCKWAPGGDRVLLAAGEKLRLWDSNSGNLLWMVHEVWFDSCWWAPGGERVLTVGVDNVMRIRDARTAEIQVMWTAWKSHMNSCAWSPDGNRLLTVHADGTACLWHAETGEFERAWNCEQGPVMSCGWAEVAQVQTVGNDGSLKWWDTRTGKCEGVHVFYDEPVASVRLSPDCERALVLDDEPGDVNLVRVATGVSEYVWDLFANGCAWSPNGTQALAIGCGGVWLLDVKAGTSNYLGFHPGVRWCTWSPDGKRVVTSGWDGATRLWDVETCVVLMVMVVRGDDHATFVPGEGGHVIEASEGAWRWLRWQVRNPDGSLARWPAETFGDLPPPRRTR